MKWYQWITACVWFQYYQYSTNHVTVIKSYLMNKPIEFKQSQKISLVYEKSYQENIEH